MLTPPVASWVSLKPQLAAIVPVFCAKYRKNADEVALKGFKGQVTELVPSWLLVTKSFATPLPSNQGPVALQATSLSTATPQHWWEAASLALRVGNGARVPPIRRSGG